MIYKDKEELKQKCLKIIAIDGNDVVILNEGKLAGELIDDLIYTAVFSADQATQEAARWLIRRAGAAECLCNRQNSWNDTKPAIAKLWKKSVFTAKKRAKAI